MKQEGRREGTSRNLTAAPPEVTTRGVADRSPYEAAVARGDKGVKYQPYSEIDVDISSAGSPQPPGEEYWRKARNG